MAVEPLTGGRRPQAFFSTVPGDSAEAVLIRYAARWSLEVSYHDAKGQLGFEEPQGWSRQAVQRTAPVAMLLYSLVLLWFAREGHRHYQPPVRPWYVGKKEASFADMLATLRCCSIKEEVSSMCPSWPRQQKPDQIPDSRRETGRLNAKVELSTFRGRFGGGGGAAGGGGGGYTGGDGGYGNDIGGAGGTSFDAESSPVFSHASSLGNGSVTITLEPAAVPVPASFMAGAMLLSGLWVLQSRRTIRRSRA